jgi:hypothetical protein
MQFTTIAHVLGLLGITPVRAFLPAFLTALVIRIGGIPYLTDAATADAALVPSWFTHHYTLLVLGLLSLLEFVATKSPEARELLLTIDQYYKPALAALTTFGVVSASDASAAETLLGGPFGVSLFPIAAMTLGSISASVVFSMFTTAGTYLACVVRSGFVQILQDIDADDSMGLQSLFAWAEDAWVAVLVVMLVFVPVLILLLVGMCLLGLWLLRKQIDRNAAKSKVECRTCGAKLFSYATVCHHCTAPVKTVEAIDFLGQPRRVPAEDRAAHRLQLIALKKCPQCGSRLKKKSLHQTCEICHHPLAAGDSLPDSYLKMVQARLPNTLVICALLSAVPIVGLIPAIVYYRIVLVSPFRAYIGLGSSFLSRWLARIAGMILLAFFSWIPFLSALVAPILAFMNYGIYRHAFMSQWEREKRLGSEPEES